MKNIVRTLFIYLIISTSVYSQKIDSLLTVLDTAQNAQKVKTYNELFRAHIQTNPVKAIEFAREALNLGIEIDDKRGTAAAYNNIGVAYRNQGALDKALEHYILSLRLYDSLDNKEGIATTKNNISNIYSIKGDYATALKFLQESNKILVELNDEVRLVGSLNNMGNLNSNLKLYDLALDNFSESFKLSEKLGQPFADPLNNIGGIYFKQNNFQRAIEFYQRALELEKTNNNKLGMLNSLANIGIAYTKAQQAEPAQKYLGEAYQLAQELKVYSDVPDILKNSSYNYYRMGNLLDAYNVLLKYDSVREVIYGEESTKRIAQMEMVLELSDKEREYESLKKTAELKTLELKNTRLFIVIVILGVLVLVTVINYFFTDKIREFFKKP